VPTAAPKARAEKSEPREGTSYVEPVNEQRGFILDLQSGVAVPAGSYAEGVEAHSFRQFQHASGSIAGRGSFDGDIERPAFHYLAEMGVAVHWTP
jgi:hypothetical protein